jgi:DMSO/TMAO reductase YedYZ molybdopterin-dependent catalytic subunit
MVTRGFTGRRPTAAFARRLPPGQFETDDFPVLAKGPTPEVDLATWRFTLSHGPRPLASWSRAEFEALPRTVWQGDIHCVTTWSKLGVRFDGISIDTLLELAGPLPSATHVLVDCHSGYTTNLPLADLTGGKAWVAWSFDGAPLAREHGGPARLLVPHLYFWKSAKWVSGLRLLDHDERGFWEQNGYHDRGDPWLEQRYHGD